MKTKHFTLLLAVAASIGTIFASDTQVDGIWYDFDSSTKTAAVTYQGTYYGSYSNEYTGTVVIPASVTYNNEEYSVTSIGNNAFYGCSGLTYVTIGNGVTTIGEKAFYACNGLTYVIIPNSVTSIGNSAFSGCFGLTSVTIGNSVTSIGNGAFHECTSLTSVTIGNSVASIGNEAFQYCRVLSSIELPNSVTSIGNSAFYGCHGLTSVTIPNSVTSIGNNAFYGCSGLTSVTIGNSVTSIGNEAFRSCSGLTSVTIPNSVTSIGSYAFYGCSSLNVAYIGNSVISIGASAFLYCSKLYKVIMLPNTVPTGINDAFSTLSGRITYVGNTNYQSGYDVLGTQRIYPNLNSYFTVDGIVYALVNPSQRTCDIIDCDYSGNTTELFVGNSVVYRNVTLSVKSINSNAFRNNQNITKITIDFNHALPSYMASDCSNIDTLIVTATGNIGTYAFSNCSKNTHAYYFINNTGDISSNAFDNCSKLHTLIIGDSVKNIGSSAFYQCVSIVNADIYNKGGIGLNAFQSSSTNEDATYHVHNNGLINNYAFADCSSITNLTIDSCVTTIGDNAFQNCSRLEDVTIRNKGNISTQAFAGSSTQNPATYVVQNVGQIGESAFANCTSMTNLTIDTCVTTIGNTAFRNCYGLEEVIIKNKGNIGTQAFKGSSTQNPATYLVQSVGQIGESAFANCTSMTNLTIDTCVTTIGNTAFQNCYGLEDVTILNKGDIGAQAFKGSSTQNPATYTISNVGSIGESAFADCSKLQKARLGNQISSINQSAFSGCVLLDSITMPNTISSLGASAFYNCAKLAYAKLSNQLTSVGQSAFAGCSSLPELFIPKSVTSIGNGTFKGCSALSIVSFEDSSAPLSLGTNASNQGLFYDCHLDSLYIGRELNYPKTASDGYSPFYRNSSLRSIVISDFPTKVETNEFYGCTKLYSVYIGNGVTSIGDYAFSGCSSIDYFSFGNQVQTIGAEAFSDCVAMTRLYSYCQVPPTCGASALADIDKWNCTLYIPKNTINDYAAANQWMDFFFIEENEEGGEGIQYTISVDFDATKGTVTGAGVYNIGSEVILTATPAEGCVFVEWEDGSTNPERHIYAYKSETYTATFSAPNYELYNGNDIAVSGESAVSGIEIDRVSFPNAVAYSYSTTTDINLPDNICGQNNEGDWYADNIVLTDAQPFYAPYDIEAKQLSYARTFENDQWQALYVPFDMQYADFSSKVRIAYVNNVHQYDDDDNGVIDRTVIEFISVVNDDIKANWPYIVKPNTTGAMTFNVANTTLYATEENDVECQSAFTRFNVIGTYQNTPVINKYIVHNGEFELCESLQTVSPFRIYLVVTNKYPTSPQPAPMRVTFMIDGREEPAPTGVEVLYENDSTGETYDVLGRPISRPSHGIFIRNGEKILVK